MKPPSNPRSIPPHPEKSEASVNGLFDCVMGLVARIISRLDLFLIAEVFLPIYQCDFFGPPWRPSPFPALPVLVAVSSVGIPTR